MGFSLPQPQPYPTKLRQGADENKAFLGDPRPGLGQAIMQDVGRPPGLTLGRPTHCGPVKVQRSCGRSGISRRSGIWG